jgi:hypothetical protein
MRAFHKFIIKFFSMLAGTPRCFALDNENSSSEVFIGLKDREGKEGSIVGRMIFQASLDHPFLSMPPTSNFLLIFS